MRRIFEITGIVENGQITLVDRQGRRITTVDVCRVDGECDPDREAERLGWRRRCNAFESALTYYQDKEIDPWRSKCDCLYSSWIRRAKPRRNNKAPVNNGRTTWKAVCRYLHAKHLQKISRATIGRDWNEWANNAASNQSKRMRRLEERSQEQASIGS